MMIESRSLARFIYEQHSDRKHIICRLTKCRDGIEKTEICEIGECYFKIEFGESYGKVEKVVDLDAEIAKLIATIERPYRIEDYGHYLLIRFEHGVLEVFDRYYISVILSELLPCDDLVCVSK